MSRPTAILDERFCTPADLCTRLSALQAQLQTHSVFWRRSPFHDHSPAWVPHAPGLAEALLALPSSRVEHLSSNHAALTAWLSRWMPGLRELARRCELPVHAAAQPGPERFFAHVPGRKRAQVEAFAEAVRAAGVGDRRWLEWCAGKGHLGRWLAHAYGGDVLSLEWNPDLCRMGGALAERTKTQQSFQCVDVLRAPARDTLDRRHVVALHACGDLHRRLLTLAAQHPIPALDLAPCCYDRTVHDRYAGLNPEADLAPDRLALRLAVTDIRSGRAREQRRRVRELGWKLAYKVARAQYTETPTTEPLASTPRSWARLTFSQWSQRMAGRDGFQFAGNTDWAQLEEQGQRLRGRFERLNLPRLAMRRALEHWLVCDIALFLARADYRVSVSTFCAQALTPRNIIVSARAF